MIQAASRRVFRVADGSWLPLWSPFDGRRDFSNALRTLRIIVPVPRACFRFDFSFLRGIHVDRHQNHQARTPPPP